MGHSINRTKFNINQSFTIQDNSQSSDKILVSDINGVAHWNLPGSYITDQPNNHYIGEFFGGGVVVAVWVQNGIEKCLIASTENISSTSVSNNITSFVYGYEWSDTTAQSFAGYNSFGASNSSIIALQSATSSAKKCLDYLNPNQGTGLWDDWYLPSIYELNYLIGNAAIFNKVLDAYSYDNNVPKSDQVDITYFFGSFPNPPTYTTDLVVQSNINLLNFGNTKHTRYTYNYYLDETTISTIESNDADYYWSSTEDANPLVYPIRSWAVQFGTSSTFNLDATLIPKSTLGKVRPFRIADDTQKSFDFDADYIVISYSFSGEMDLDTRTIMIEPYAPQSESGYGGYFNGEGWTPDSMSNPAHPNSSTYSIVWHGGDNVGMGYETVLINLEAFKLYYPGQAEIVIDARAHWYVGGWVPDFIPGDQARLDASPPVMLDVKLYKGGEPIKNPLDDNQWINPTAGASMSINSYGKVINVEYIGGLGTGMRVSQFKYNVLGKFGYLFSD